VARERWRRTLLAKGQDVAKRLERLLAGENVRLLDFDLLHGGEPGERPKERLRRTMDMLVGKARSVDSPDFGRCERCEGWLEERQLDETPWATVCPRCASGVAP
jgi:RNA polymerase-binding transcription factor DksA